MFVRMGRYILYITYYSEYNAKQRRDQLIGPGRPSNELQALNTQKTLIALLVTVLRRDNVSRKEGIAAEVLWQPKNYHLYTKNYHLYTIRTCGTIASTKQNMQGRQQHQQHQSSLGQSVRKVGRKSLVFEFIFLPRPLSCPFVVVIVLKEILYSGQTRPVIWAQEDKNTDTLDGSRISIQSTHGTAPRPIRAAVAQWKLTATTLQCQRWFFVLVLQQIINKWASLAMKSLHHAGTRTVRRRRLECSKRA